MGRLLCILALLLLPAGFCKHVDVDRFQASVPSMPRFVESTQTTVIAFLKDANLYASDGSTLSDFVT